MFGSAKPVGPGPLPGSGAASGNRIEQPPAATSLTVDEVIALHVARARLDRVLFRIASWGR